MKQEKSAAEEVNEIANREIETIRLMLCPEESDVSVEKLPNGSYTLSLDCEVVLELTAEIASGYDLEDGEGVDHDWIVSDYWDDLREWAYERFCEYGLSFDYIEGDHGEPGHFCYLISTGGPGTEIRFYTDPGFNLYRAEFWYLPWFDGACKNVTNDDTVQALWEQFQECSAEHVYQQAVG